MPPNNSWYSQQFREKISELMSLCDRYCADGNIDDFDKATRLQSEINNEYELAWDLISGASRAHRWNELSKKYGGNND